MPQALIIVYVALIWAHREIEIILMLGGQLFCEGINWILKRIIKETRPNRRALIPNPTIIRCCNLYIGLLTGRERERAADRTGKGYGMPSSHAQFVYFFAAYLSLWMLFRVRYVPRAQRYFFSAAIQILALMVAQARVYLHYHTPKQVMVGMFAGLSIGVFCFAITGILRKVIGGLIWDILLDNPISRFLYIKDMCTEVMLQQMEWNVWNDERQRRRSKFDTQQSNKTRFEIKKE